MQEYKKVPQLPTGLDFQLNILLPDNSSGENWVVADGNEFRKRPGLRPVLHQIAPDATNSAYLSSWTVAPLQAPRGVTAAAEFVVGNQLRQNSFDKLTPRPGSGLSDNLFIYNDTQLVTIQDGRPVVIRKVPVMRFSGLIGAYTFGPDETGTLRFTMSNTQPGSEALTNSIVVTETTTLLDVALAANNVVETYLVDELYQKSAAFSPFPSLAGLPASCLVRTTGGNWFNLDQYYNYIYAYVPFEMPLSYPYSGSTAWSLPMPNPPVYRAFYTQDVAGRDGNVMAIQFQEEMLFAGKGDALMSFDGYRMSVAGCLTQTSMQATTLPASGSLSAGNYNYLLRSKIQKPSGQIVYGPPITADYQEASQLLQLAVPAGAAIQINTSPSVLTKEVEAAGSTYSQVAASPRRQNPMTDNEALLATYNVSATDGERVKPQIGEYLCGPIDAASIASQRGVIQQVTPNVNGGYFIDAPNLVVSYFSPLALGESWEIYRTAAGGNFYYHVQTVPAGSTYIDQLSDATLFTNPPYVAKAYNIIRPPDCCMAVAQHQNRIVVVGEYLVDPNGYDVSDVTLSSNRPYIKNVYWSQPNTEEFNPVNNVVLDVTEGGELNSVISTGDALYVGGGESMWVIQGNLASAGTFTVNRIAGAGGTVGNTAVAALNGQVYAVSRAGLYQLVGGAADYTVGKLINAYIREVNEDLLKFTRVVALKNNAGLAVIIPGMIFERPAQQSTNNNDVFPGSFIATERASDTVTFVFDPNTQAWSQWTGTEMYMGGGLVEFDDMTWAFPRKSDKPISVLDSMYGKDGFDTPVEMRIRGPWQTNGDIFTDKSFIRFRVFSAAGGRQNFVLTTKIERNFNDDEPVQQAEIGFRDGKGYAESPYGETPWGDANEMAQQLPMTNQKALSVRAVIENSDPAEFPSITGWNFEIAEPRKHMKQE